MWSLDTYVEISLYTDIYQANRVIETYMYDITKLLPHQIKPLPNSSSSKTFQIWEDILLLKKMSSELC